MAEFILSKSRVLEQYNQVKSISDRVSYSSKTNPEVSKVLEEETDCLFSVHSERELKNLSDYGRVIYLAQGWSEEVVERLLKKGIKRFVVDNKPDLEVFKRVLREEQKEVSEEITLGLRLKLKEHSLETERYFVFGFSSEDLNREVSELNREFENLRVGVHFHRKTQNLSEWSLKREVDRAVSKETLEVIEFINTGGGLPAEYANTNKKVIDNVVDRIEKFKEWVHKEELDMIIEPGRFIAAPSVKLKTEILRIYNNNVIVDASVYNSDMDALIVPVKLLVEGEVGKEEGEPYVVKGKTPCSRDLFRYRVYLKDPEEGDELVFLNAGAYNFCTDFCSLEKIPTKVVE